MLDRSDDEGQNGNRLANEYNLKNNISFKFFSRLLTHWSKCISIFTRFNNKSPKYLFIFYTHWKQTVRDRRALFYLENTAILGISTYSSHMCRASFEAKTAKHECKVSWRCERILPGKRVKKVTILRNLVSFASRDVYRHKYAASYQVFCTI